MNHRCCYRKADLGMFKDGNAPDRDCRRYDRTSHVTSPKTCACLHAPCHLILVLIKHDNNHFERILSQVRLTRINLESTAPTEKKKKYLTTFHTTEGRVIIHITILSRETKKRHS